MYLGKCPRGEAGTLLRMGDARDGPDRFWGTAMNIKFAKDSIIEPQRAACWPVWLTNLLSILEASENNFLSFATVAPLTKVGMSTRPCLTTGFASYSASVAGANGLAAKLKTTKSGQFRKLFTGITVLLFCAADTAVAEDEGHGAAGFARIGNPVLTKLSPQASVRIISLDEARPRARFSASGLPVGLAIDSQTGVIGGVFDREANRNNGAPFIITVNIALGNSASGASTIKLHIENRPPLAVDDALHLSQKPIQLNVLANDIDPDGDRLVLTDAGALYGTVAFMADGLVAYAPNFGRSSPDIITYTISDGHGGSAAGQILVTIK